jgi:hypothetical protein
MHRSVYPRADIGQATLPIAISSSVTAELSRQTCTWLRRVVAIDEEIFEYLEKREAKRKIFRRSAKVRVE